MGLGVTIATTENNLIRRDQPTQESKSYNYKYHYTRDIPGHYFKPIGDELVRLDYIERRMIEVKDGEKRVVGREYRWKDGETIRDPSFLADSEWGF